MRGKIIRGFKFFRDIAVYFYQGFKTDLALPYTKQFLSLVKRSAENFHQTLFIKKTDVKHIADERIVKLQKTAKGLYSLLPNDPRFSYSILYAIHHPQPHLFKISLQSVLDQSPPHIDVIIGYAGIPSKEVSQIVQNLKYQSSRDIREFVFDAKESEIFILNQLAQKASGNFLLQMGQEDWLRPDLLFRYEQTLRITQRPEMTVLYCDENKINAKNFFIPLSEPSKPSHLPFPFVFNFFHEHGLLVPKHLWKLIEGLRQGYVGAQYEDLILRLDLVGANFIHIPISLYSSRQTKAIHQEKQKLPPSLLEALKDYTKAKKLDWEWSLDSHQMVKAAPTITNQHSIQVIIPFKDQKDLTLKCIHSLLKQENVSFKITAVDNNSQDRTIAEEIQQLGGEVISIQEPFNYSRLNNIAVKQTNTASDCDVLLFLNNDIELKPNALYEMVRWVDQPHIGIVGCRLHYPDGTLQHSGIALNHEWIHKMQWEHTEKFRTFEHASLAKQAHVTDAVTAACAMMKRSIFCEVGGFDEIWYPIGYSDTNLAVKVRSKGLLCFYTPDAIGIHYESISRKVSIEDYENTWWLHNLLYPEKVRNNRL